MPLLICAVVAVWVLAVAAMLLWCLRRRRKPGSHTGVGTQPSPSPPTSEDNNALHNSVAAAREHLNHIKNPIEKATPNLQHLLQHHVCQDKNSVNARVGKPDVGGQSDDDQMDKRLQKARFPRAPPPPYSLVDWGERAPHRTSKQDNRQLQSLSRTEFIL